VEALLQQAVQERVKENLVGVLERIDREGIVIDSKALSDAKNVLSKLK
jgi:DNA polymerase I-like protein with 3'-5' exonuclease and polymerase domains